MSTALSTNVVTETNASTVIEEINKRFFDVPFENSQFQTENFVLAAALTPERAYRSLGLRLTSRLQALQEAQFGAAKEEIDIEELQEKIANPDTNKFDRRRAEIDIQQKYSNRGFTAKLINDAIVECNVLYGHMKKMPEYTREEFEAGEQEHFTVRLTRATQGIEGARESLINMSTDMPSLLQYEAETVAAMLLLQQQTPAA